MEGSILVRDFAKMIYEKDTLEIGEKKLYIFLREKKILANNNKPMQNYIEMGIFELKNAGTVSHKQITYITNKGQTYLYDRINKEYNI
jgi:phage antirepressor YoqD-like protein